MIIMNIFLIISIQQEVGGGGVSMRLECRLCVTGVCFSQFLSTVLTEWYAFFFTNSVMANIPGGGGGGTSTIYWWGSPGAVKTYPNSVDKPP